MTTTGITKGQQVTILPDAPGNYLDADFPGWGAEGYREHLRPIAEVAGMTATVTSISSHGSNPWTRYNLLLANGGRIIDAVPCNEFTTN